MLSSWGSPGHTGGYLRARCVLPPSLHFLTPSLPPSLPFLPPSLPPLPHTLPSLPPFISPHLLPSLPPSPSPTPLPSLPSLSPTMATPRVPWEPSKCPRHWILLSKKPRLSSLCQRRSGFGIVSTQRRSAHHTVMTVGRLLPSAAPKGLPSATPEGLPRRRRKQS